MRISLNSWMESQNPTVICEKKKTKVLFLSIYMCDKIVSLSRRRIWRLLSFCIILNTILLLLLKTTNCYLKYRFVCFFSLRFTLRYNTAIEADGIFQLNWTGWQDDNNKLLQSDHKSITRDYYMVLSDDDWELPNSRIWLAEIDIGRSLDFPI